MAERKVNGEAVVLDTSTLKPGANPKTVDKKLKPVVKANGVTKRKKTLSERLTGIFVSEDAGDVKTYLIMDIFIPALKDTIVDMILGGVEALFYGNNRPRGYSGGLNNTGPKVSYQKFYDQPSSRRASSFGSSGAVRTGQYNPRANNDTRNIIFTDKRDAVAVLDALVDITIEYNVATILDLKELASIESEFTDNDFGWDDLRGARVKPVRGGYILDLPPTIPVD